MHCAFGFEQQSYGVQQGAQHQSYSIRQEETRHSNNSHNSGVKFFPPAAPVCFDSELSKHYGMSNGSHATNDGWFGPNMHQKQKQSNGWSGSGSGFGSGKNNTGHYNHAASGAVSGTVTNSTGDYKYNHAASGGGSDSGFGSVTGSTGHYNHATSGAVSAYVPAISVLDVSQFSNQSNGCKSFNSTSNGGSYETIEVKYVPGATVKVHEVRYKRTSANWGVDEDDGLQHSIMGAGMLNGCQRVEPKRKKIYNKLRRALA